MLEATEVDFWRRAETKSRRERVTNIRITEMIGIAHIIMDNITTKQLIWYGYVQRMQNSRLPKTILTLNPSEVRKKGRPRRS